MYMYIDCNFHLYICISQYIRPHNAVGRDYIIADVEDKLKVFFFQVAASGRLQ